MGKKHRPETAAGWGGHRGTGWDRQVNSGQSSGLTEMMKLLAHSLGNLVHFKDNWTMACLSTSLTWFNKEIIDDSCSSFEAAVML